jgi:hypothetical protein
MRAASGPVRGAHELADTLRRIDNRPYGAYRDCEGLWRFGSEGQAQGNVSEFTLAIDHVQSDPFAPPSRCHVFVPMGVACFPPGCLSDKVRRTALCDFLTRAFYANAHAMGVDQRTESGGYVARALITPHWLTDLLPARLLHASQPGTLARRAAKC